MCEVLDPERRRRVEETLEMIEGMIVCPPESSSLPPGLWDRIREMERRERGCDIVQPTELERLNR